MTLATGVPNAKLIDRAVYKLDGRNLNVGVWNAKNQYFVGIAVSFGTDYLDYEYEWETSEKYGTAKALELITIEIPDSIPILTNLPQQGKATFRQVRWNDEERAYMYLDTQEQAKEPIIEPENTELLDFLAPLNDEVKIENLNKYRD